MIPKQTTSTTVTFRPVSSCRRNMSMHPQSDEQQIDELYADERGDHAAHAVDQEVSPQDGGRAHRLELDAAQRQRDEYDDDDGVEDDRRQDGRMGIVQSHDV